TNVVLAGGSIRPGATSADGNVGTLAMSSLNAVSGDIRPDLVNASSYDRILVSGQAIFNGPTTITPILNPFTIATATPYTLLSATGGVIIAPGFTPVLSGLPANSRLSFGLT